MAGISRILREALKRLLEGRAAKGATSMDMSGLGRTVSRGLDDADADFFAMMGRDGPAPTPEEALGRPLTPDHIWNDPRFQHRLALTYPMEGVVRPATRFEAAGERIADDLAERTARQREIGPSHDMESLIGMARNMRPGEFSSALDADLGDYAVGGLQQNAPLLGAALTAGAGGGLTLREILRNRQRTA